MINLVEARNSRGGLLSFPLQDISSGYVVKEINGLDPVKATVSSSSFALQDGARYQHSRRETRNITIKLGLEAHRSGGSVQDLRNLLYSFFMPKSEIRFRFFMSNGLEVNIDGLVESFETPLFTKEPQVQISLICFDPDFYDENPVRFYGMTTAGLDEIEIEYYGTVDTGFEFTLEPDRNIGGITLYLKTSNNETHTMIFEAPLSAGDVLVISTVPGAKGATLTRNGNESSILWGIAPYMDWLGLSQGVNYFRAHVEGVGVPYGLSYINRYGGL